MTALNRTPQNTNPLQPTKFVLTFDRIGEVQYFCQQVNLPSISLGEVNRATPLLDLYSPGTKLEFSPLVVNFIIDEEMITWKNMYNWFKSIANPEAFDGRQESSKHFSDATLTVLNNLNNPVVRIQFANCFPKEISDLQFDTTLSADNIMTATMTFRYDYYKYLPT